MRVNEQGLPGGRVSIAAVSAVLRAIQIGLRAESSAINVRKSGRGRKSRLVSESTGMSLVKISDGSGVMELESEASSLLDIPAQLFEDLVIEASRPADDLSSSNIGVRRALLSLESLFRDYSKIESNEFIDGNGRAAPVTSATIAVLRDQLTDNESDDHQNNFRVTGRVLELNLVQQSFEVHTFGSSMVIRYDDYLENAVLDSLKCFVTAEFLLNTNAQRTLVSINTIDAIPESQFDNPRSIRQKILDQGIVPMEDFESLAMTTLTEEDIIPLERFQSEIKELRREPS